MQKPATFLAVTMMLSAAAPVAAQPVYAFCSHVSSRGGTFDASEEVVANRIFQLSLAEAGPIPPDQAPALANPGIAVNAPALDGRFTKYLGLGEGSGCIVSRDQSYLQARLDSFVSESRNRGAGVRFTDWRPKASSVPPALTPPPRRVADWVCRATVNGPVRTSHYVTRFAAAFQFGEPGYSAASLEWRAAIKSRFGQPVDSGCMPAQSTTPPQANENVMAWAPSSAVSPGAGGVVRPEARRPGPGPNPCPSGYNPDGSVCAVK